MKTLRVFAISLSIVLTAATLGAQSTVPRFDTVSIRLSSLVDPGVDVVNIDCVNARCAIGAGGLEPGRAVFNSVSMLKIIAAAFGVKVSAVVEGPNWLATDRFDIYAQTSASTTLETMRAMVQGLLAERFGLVVRRESRPMPGYVLRLGAGKLRATEPTVPLASPVCDRSSVPDPNGGPVVTVTCKSQTMKGLASLLSNGPLQEPVTDATGIQGAYDFTLTFRTPGTLVRPASDPLFNPSKDISVPDAVEKLGLKLEHGLQPAPVLIVDRVNRRPSDDARMPSALPALPTEFEVAEIRPTQPNAPAQNDRYLPGGQVEMHGWTLARMIKLAYSISDDELVGGPKWLDDDRFDILAKTALTRDELRVVRGAHGLINYAPKMYEEMMQKLLAERFGLTIHKEVQPVTVFVLTVADRSLKFKESSPSTRSQCTDVAEIALDTYTCQNITFSQFAVNVHNAAPGYFNRSLVDKTGLKGSYDLTLKWNAAALMNSPGNRGEPGAAAEPMSYITVFEALEKQLGLKATLQKFPMPVVVIDHIERTPRGN